jgi:hypothetical protein
MALVVFGKSYGATMMQQERGHEQETWIETIIAKELTSQGDLLPPWQKYPQIPHGSLGWKMGPGESYGIAWRKWAEGMEKDQLAQYFRRHAPIPVEWLSWVATQFGDQKIAEEMFAGTGDFAGIHMLERLGLASFAEFAAWLEKSGKIQKR